MKAADIKPGRVAVLSMQDTVQAMPSLLRPVVDMSLRALVALHGEPTDDEREAWLALTPEERRALVETQKRTVLRKPR